MSQARNQWPLRVEYTDVNNVLRWSEPFFDYRMAQYLIVTLTAAGATGFSVFHDGSIRPTTGASYSKYPGHTDHTRKWNGGIR